MDRGRGEAFQMPSVSKLVLLSAFFAMVFMFVTLDPYTTDLVKADVPLIQYSIILLASVAIGASGFVEVLKKKF